MTVNIRFSQLSENTTNPIIIRFEIIPTIPFGWGQIGSITSFDFSDGVDHQIDTLLSWSLFRRGNDISVAYTGLARVGNQINIAWKIMGWHDTTFDVVYSDLPLVEQLIKPTWGITDLYAIETKISWLVPSRKENRIDNYWQSKLIKHEILNKVNFESSLHPKHIELNAIWRSGSDQDEVEYNIFYGPHKSRWICTTDYRPPTGKVTIRFSDLVVTPTGSVTVRFTPSEEFCYYDDGGGPLENGGSLPNFDFKVPIEPQIRRAYLMQPTLIVTRVSDGTPIVVDSVSISNSRGQFTASGSIDFSSKGDADNAINNLLLVEINGYDFYLLPEEITRSQSFGRSQYSASCRSRIAQIASPLKSLVSYSNNVDRSLAGIMGDILTGTGWSVELIGFLDFNIPAGVFSITGKAPIESVNEIADMVGCILIPDEFTSVIKVVPRWPVTPWNMGTEVSDINIHDAVIITYSARDELNQLCDSCWVRGEQQGVSRHVRRTGTSGNIPTSDVSNSLIVTDTAARLVGTAKIVDTGKKERVTVSLPVMDDLPPLVKGMLIGVTYFGEVYKTTCDSVSITASVNSDGDIDVTQTANLVRHME